MPGADEALLAQVVEEVTEPGVEAADVEQAGRPAVVAELAPLVEFRAPQAVWDDADDFTAACR